jgi:hypothetical protein
LLHLNICFHVPEIEKVSFTMGGERLTGLLDGGRLRSTSLRILMVVLLQTQNPHPPKTSWKMDRSQEALLDITLFCCR